MIKFAFKLPLFSIQLFGGEELDLLHSEGVCPKKAICVNPNGTWRIYFSEPFEDADYPIFISPMSDITYDPQNAFAATRNENYLELTPPNGNPPASVNVLIP